MRTLFNDDNNEGYFTWEVIGYTVVCAICAPFEWFWHWMTNENTPLGNNLFETGLFWLGFALLIKHVYLFHSVVGWLLICITVFGIIFTAVGYITRSNSSKNVILILAGIVVNCNLMLMYKDGTISQAPYHLITLLSFVYLILSPWALLYFGEQSCRTQVRNLFTD